jgi:hypothetical protein
VLRLARLPQTGVHLPCLSNAACTRVTVLAKTGGVIHMVWNCSLTLCPVPFWSYPAVPNMAAEAAMKNSALSRDQTAEMPLSATPSGTPSGTPSEGGFAKLDPQSRVNRPSDPPQQIIRRDE